MRLTYLFSLWLAFAVSAEPSPHTAGVSNAPVTYVTAFDGAQYGAYHIAVLEAALAVTAPEYGPVHTSRYPVNMTQSRQIATLEQGQADIMWRVTTDALEQRLLPVRFPLLQGFSGIRVLAIHPSAAQNYHPDLNLADLKSMISIQGEDWPDYAILKANGFRVSGESWTNWYDSMYKSLAKGVVDYCPRNIIEVHRDFRHHKDTPLAIEAHHLLQYDSYEYFFVAPGHPQLQRRLVKGIEILLESGELASIFNRYSDHKKAVKLLQESRKVYYLSNPGLSYKIKSPRWLEAPARMLNEIRRLNPTT